MRFPLPLLLLAFAASLPGAAQGQVSRSVLAMGTLLSLEVDGDPSAAEGALAEVAALELRCSTWRPDSLWSRLNAGEAAALPAADRALLRRVRRLAAETGGCFDPVMGRLVQAWGLRAGGRVPSAEALAEARAASGLDHLQEGPDRLTGGAWIEEGGFLKGQALDLMLRQLRQGGVRSGLLDFGGQLLAWGPARPVSLADPRDRKRPRLAFALRDASVSTSGVSERGRHILDPRSGRPCEAWGAVSVVHPSALEADILSTALYVMGPERGRAWAEARGLAAAFLLNDGTVQLTAPFRALHPRTL